MGKFNNRGYTLTETLSEGEMICKYKIFTWTLKRNRMNPLPLGGHLCNIPAVPFPEGLEPTAV
jgi:hypothetical protein